MCEKSEFCAYNNSNLKCSIKQCSLFDGSRSECQAALACNWDNSRNKCFFRSSLSEELVSEDEEDLADYEEDEEE